VIPLMREAGIEGRILPWDDVLHEGPVPAGLNVAALRQVRAEFIASGMRSFDEVARSFAARDAALADLTGVDEIVLWFEHDLYDQLQLVQILERLSPDRIPSLTAVPGDDYLGTQPSSQFAGLFAARRPITSAQHVAARDAWDAFRASDPRAIVDVLPRLSALPHLAPALRRHLQQFPSVENGLSRTEQQALEAIAAGVTPLKRVYVASNHEREDAVFMGDLVFLEHLKTIARGARPLLTPFASFADDVRLTGNGRRVLDRDADRVTLCGIDRWLGGVHLTGTGPTWRWDAARDTVRRA
jgi:hypothetical protein